MVQKQQAFSRNRALNFDLFLGYPYAVQYCLAMLGTGREPQLPGSHTIRTVNSRYSTVYSIGAFSTYNIFNMSLLKHNPMVSQGTSVVPAGLAAEFKKERKKSTGF